MKKKIAPFPQANNIELIYEIFCNLKDSGISKFDIMNKYGLHDRQGAYYLDALLFLDLVEKINIKYFIRSEIMNIVGDNTSISKSKFCELVLRHNFINLLYEETKTIKSETDKKNYIAAKIREKYKLGAGTSERRASTIVNWIIWIIKNMEGDDCE